MITRNLFYIVIILLLSLSLVIACEAPSEDTYEAPSENTHPCSDDLEKFCKDVQPGGGRIIECLENHENELSAACRVKFQDVMKRINEAKEACAQDIENICKDVQPGGGRIARCLKENKEEISPECMEKLEIVMGKGS
jgi:hypothetical protein